MHEHICGRCRDYMTMNFRGTLSLGAALCAFAAVNTASAAFTVEPIAGLPGMDSSAVAWGDFDNDGLLDFLLTGTTNNSGSGATTRLWRNTGAGFVQVPMAAVPGVVFGSTCWNDFDNDGRLDFLLTGTTNGILTGNVSQLWRNTGSGFENVTATSVPGLPRLNQTAASWADMDNNGTADLFISGLSSTGRVAQIWRNTGGVLTNATSALAPGLPGFDIGTAAWGDFDNDGRMDLIIAGDTGSGRIAQVWRNTGSTLTNATAGIAAGLPPVSFASSAWGDYDNDGLLDFVITGESSTGRVTQIWRNAGSTFTNATTSLVEGIAALRYGTSAWADFDNDGRLDLLLTGNPAGGTFFARILRNTGSGFADAEELLPAAYSTSGPSAAWGDFNNDGKLDVLITGTSAEGGMAQLLRNTGELANTPPPAPAQLLAVGTNGTVHLQWGSVMDAESGSNVTYNVRVGTTAGGSEIMASIADLESGFRRLPQFGNVQLGTNTQLTLPPGTYFWSVQAVDGALAGGGYAEELPLVIPTETAPRLTIVRAGTNATISWTPSTIGWTLQETSSLSVPAWTNSPSGTLNPVSVSADQLQRFYRLRQQ